MNPPFRFIDLFAGIGGIRMGLEQAGGKCVYSVEIDRFARTTYEANFGLCEGTDIRQVRGSDLPPYDVLAAGFPCQPFSIAGTPVCVWAADGTNAIARTSSMCDT